MGSNNNMSGSVPNIAVGNILNHVSLRHSSQNIQCVLKVLILSSGLTKEYLLEPSSVHEITYHVINLFNDWPSKRNSILFKDVTFPLWLQYSNSNSDYGPAQF